MRSLFKTIKIKFTMSKLTLLLRLYEHYERTENKSKLAEVSMSIDTEAAVLMDLKPEAAPVAEKLKAEEKKVEATPAPEKTTPKPAAPPAKPAEKPAEKTAPKPAPAAKVEPVAEVVKEGIITIYPFYEMSVEHHGKRKDINFKDIKREGFEVYESEEVKLAAKDSSLMTADELEMVFDEAWDRICKGESLKNVNIWAKEQIGAFYGKQMKTDSDYYGKLTGPMGKLIAILRRAFGIDGADCTAIVVRPGWSVLEDDGTMGTEAFTIDSAVTFTKPAEKKVEEKEPAKAEAKGMKTIKEQTAAPAAETVVETEEVMDEEAQETAPETTEEEPAAEEVAEEETTEEDRDVTQPPAVNKFDEFNDLEREIYNRLKIAKKSCEGKSEEEAKTIVREAKEEVKSLIAAYYEDEVWVEKTVEGRWPATLITYFNKITTEIGSRLSDK